MSHYWRNNDPGQNQTWNGPVDIATGLGPVNAVSLVQSNSGSGPGYLDVVADMAGRLAHFSRIDIPDWRWSGPHFFDSKLTVWVEPYPVPTAQLVTVTVRAKDRFTNQLVDGAVMVSDNRTGTHPPIMIGRTNTPIRQTFSPKTVRIFDPESRTWTTETTYPTGFVRAAGYVDMDIDWGFPEG